MNVRGWKLQYSANNRAKYVSSTIVLGMIFVGVIVSMGIGAPFDKRISSGSLVLNPQSQQSQTPTLLPKSPIPLTSMYVVKPGPGGSLGLTLTALEGLIARSSPALFVETSGDAFWLNYTITTYGLSTSTVTSAFALQHFESYVTDGSGRAKIVVFDSNDPIAPAQEDMAITIAGANNALPVASSDLSSVQQIFGLSNIDTIVDLRTVNNGGEFTDYLTAYTWLWNNYGSLASKQLIGLNPGSFAMSDYLVEFKAFTFWFGTSSISSSDLSFASTVVSSYPENTPAIGFFGLGGEVSTIRLLSQYQILMVPDSQVADLSFYSGFPTVRMQQVPSTPIAYDPSKTYVMFSFSQGDAFGYDFYTNLGTWQAIDPNTNLPYREEIPSSFQTSPVLVEAAPPILRYWYSTMYSDNSFMTGASGGGYVYPDSLPNITSWLSIAGGLQASAGLNQPFILLSQSKDVTPTYSTIINSLSPYAIFTKQNGGNPPFTVGNVPVFDATVNIDSNKNVTLSQVITQIEGASSTGDHFIFAFMNAANPGYPFIAQVASSLGSNYVFVDSTQLVSLYDQSKGITSTTGQTSTSSSISTSSTPASSTTTLTSHSSTTTTRTNTSSTSRTTQTSSYTSSKDSTSFSTDSSSSTASVSSSASSIGSNATTYSTSTSPNSATSDSRGNGSSHKTANQLGNSTSGGVLSLDQKKSTALTYGFSASVAILGTGIAGIMIGVKKKEPGLDSHWKW